MNGKIMLNGKAYSSSGRPSREITMAEWIALPDTKYTDGIVYYIKDIGGANQFPPLIYSDEEREVGVWRDGKPLYQKTINFGALPNSTTKSVAHGISNVTGESFKKIDTIMALSGANGFAIPYRITDDGSDVKRQVFFEVNATNVIAYSRNYNNSVFDTCFITLQYTKITDTPGSGTWNADGTYAKHYSTTEKVIGTWIDGKPLYEKSFKFQNDTNWVNEKTFNTGVSNIDWGWVEKAVFKDYGVGRFETVPFYQTISSSGASSYMQVDLQISSCNLILRSPGGSTWTANPNRYLAVTIRYTKTTD